MGDSQDAAISLGRWDPYRRTPSVLLGNETIKFLPGPGVQDEFNVKEAAFPPGARLEYRVQKGDRYFEGDHSLSLGRTLWVIEPDGRRSLMASGFVLYISLAVASRNLKKRGIPFRAVSFYEAKDGQVVENEISQSGARFEAGLILGLSNLLLGAIAGTFLHNVSQIIALGAFGFAIYAIVTMRSAASKRDKTITTAMTLFTYAAGYFAAVVLVRSVVGGLTGS